MEDGEEAMAVINDETEVVLLDLNMPKLGGFGCLERLAKSFPALPPVVVSAADEARLADRRARLVDDEAFTADARALQELAHVVARLVATDDEYDPVSGMPRMGAIPISIRAAG